MWLQKWVPRLLKHSGLALWRELRRQATFLKSCAAERRNREGSRNKAPLSHKLLTSFIPRSHYRYAHCPDTVQSIDISFSRVPILTTEKGNPRGLAAIAFVMTSCTSDESKSLTVLGKNSLKPFSESLILRSTHQLSVYKDFAVFQFLFEKQLYTFYLEHRSTEVVRL